MANLSSPAPIPSGMKWIGSAAEGETPRESRQWQMDVTDVWSRASRGSVGVKWLRFDGDEKRCTMETSDVAIKRAAGTRREKYDTRSNARAER